MMSCTRITAGLRMIAAIVACLLCVGVAAAEPAPDFIRAKGRQLVDSRGAPFAIKGINLGNWLITEGYMFEFKRALAPHEIEHTIETLIGPQDAARFWDEFRDVFVAADDIRFIKAAGFNTVRVPLNWRLFVKQTSDGGYSFEGKGWMLLDRVIGWCREAGLRVIVDLHAAPGGQTGVNHDDGVGYPLTFYVPEYRRMTIALWRALATHYRDEPAVLGYDLLNEPISPYSDETYLNPRLEGFYRDIVAAIRSVDRNHAVMLAGAQWSTNFAVFGKPFDGNAIYTYHSFWATPDRAAVESYVDFAMRWDVPVLVGETGEANDAWNESFRRLNERFGIGWCFWTYKNLATQTTVVSIAKPKGWSLIAKAGSEALTAEAVKSLPPRAEAKAILDAYLDGARLKNGHINAGYLKSLGLSVPTTN